jgi:uncharacterized delta-60 repeat protein
MDSAGRIVVPGTFLDAARRIVIPRDPLTGPRVRASAGRAACLPSCNDRAMRTTRSGKGSIIAAAAFAVTAIAGPCLASAADSSGIVEAFGEGGLVVTDMGGADDAARGVVVGADGSVTVVGEARPDAQHLRGFAISRLLPDGTPDPAFGEDGRAWTAFGELQGSGAQAAALQPDGKLVAVGFGRHPDVFHDTFALARYEPGGRLDTAFGDRGKVLTAVDAQTGAGRNDVAHAVAVDPEGRIVVAGETGQLFKDFAIARYLADGSLDPSFGGTGIVVTDIGGDDRANAIAVQPDGQVLVAGSGWQADANEGFALVRYGPDGSLDASFGNGGVVTTDFRGGGDRAYGVALRPDGRIVAGGVAQLSGGCSPSACERYGFGLAQYAPDGTLDTGFGDGGLIYPDFTVSAGGYGLALLPDGTAAVAGHIGNEDFGLLFVTPEGVLLPVEGGDAVRIDFAGGMDRAFAVAAALDGSVIAVGDAATTDGAFDFGLVRYRPPDSAAPTRTG